MFRERCRAAGMAILGVVFTTAAMGQFTNRYPKVKGYNHHIYLEGYELPIFSIGPVDPALSPDGRLIAVAHRGWLWSLDIRSGEAKRLTTGTDIDSRPAWSPDGNTIAFVRDNTRDTKIFALDLESGSERLLVDTLAIDLDPTFSADGKWLYYSSAAEGDLDLWRMGLADGTKERLTQEEGLELKPSPSPDGKSVAYIHKTRRGNDAVRILDLETKSSRTLRSVSIASQTRPALSPDGRSLALTLPLGNTDWGLYLLDLADPHYLIPLDSSSSLPITPAWSPDGQRIYFSDAGRDQMFTLKSISTTGGVVSDTAVTRWDWGVPTRRVSVRTELEGDGSPVPARLSAWDEKGHPLVAERAQPRFDSQNGRVYFYSPGVVDIEAPVGTLLLAAVQGLATPQTMLEVPLRQTPGLSVTLQLKRLWDPREAGYYSGDHHFHLNYGGPYRLVPEDLLPMLRGEDLDVATPLLANLHNRPQDLKWLHWKHLDETPLIAFGQEVRAHFLGHLGLFGIDSVFWPWFWGPGYPVYSRDDRPNAEALRFARRQGGVNTYVHPVGAQDPFDDANLSSIPLDLIPDAVQGDLDGLEVACLWSDELGTSQLWYRFLNLGLPIAPTAGTDAFPNFYRSMAVGSTRVYVRPDGPLNLHSYLRALKEGRSFVSTGPLIDFQVAEAGPGGVAPAAGGETEWKLRVASATPVEKVEILVNGAVVDSQPGLASSGVMQYRGRLTLPAGGWVAARAYGTPSSRPLGLRLTVWPVMDSYPFAHSGPVWIGKKGSTEPEARRRAAMDLLRALDVAERRLHEGYGGTPIPRLRERFDQARAMLSRLVD